MVSQLVHFDRIERRVLFAVELLDPIAQTFVYADATVNAAGLARRPIVNASGRFVWLEEGTAWPTRITFDPGPLPFAAEDVAALPQPADIADAPEAARRQRIVLRPTQAYPFDAGVSAVRGTLIESNVGPHVPVAGAELRLQWIDDNFAGTLWIDSPLLSASNADGDFAVALRLAPAMEPRLAASGALIVRLRAARQGAARMSQPFSLPPGRVADALPFAWSELLP